MTEDKSVAVQGAELLNTHTDFINGACNIMALSRREVCLLSNVLDPLVYDNEEIYQALVDFIRRERNCRVKILVKEIKPIVEQGHYLLRLARRLSSKVEIRVLSFEPRNKDRAWLMGDRSLLLYKHDDTVYKGFIDLDAKVKCLELQEEFSWLWDKHSEVDPSLRNFLL